MSIFKTIAIVVPIAAVTAIGVVSIDELGALVADKGVEEQAITGPSAETNAALAALAAVTSAAQAQPAPAPATTSQQLTALLEAPQPEPAAPAAEVTRSTGFATAQVTPEAEVALATPSTPQAQAPAAQVGADFFSAAQANLSQATACVEDLRNVAGQTQVYFPSGALTGDAIGISQARLLGKIAQRCQGVSIEVQGHSDPSGDPAVNLRLSQERAESVIVRIAAAGIDTSRFVAVGLGSARPSGVTGTEPDAFYDRRVEFEILDTALPASFGTPAFGTVDYASVACVIELQDAADTTSITFAPGSVTTSRADLTAAVGLAQLAVSCPQARLRVVGQHAQEYGDVEDPATGRMRAVALMTMLVGAGFPSEQIIISAPSDSRPINGLSNSRIDFDVILEEL